MFGPIFGISRSHFGKNFGVSFGSNVPPVLLINPYVFQEFSLKGKLSPQKNQARLGQNRPKLAKLA